MQGFPRRPGFDSRWRTREVRHADPTPAPVRFRGGRPAGRGTADQGCRAGPPPADAAQARRLPALAAIYDGASRTDAAKIGGVTLQIVRDWVLRFNAQGPDGLIDRKAPGRPRRLDDAHRAALATAIEG